MNLTENRLPANLPGSGARKSCQRMGTGAAFTVAFGLLLASLLPVSGAHGAGTTAANFLTLGAGARIEAMGGCGTALASGVDGVYWNAASLGRSASHEFSFSHATWFADIGYEHLGFIHPLGDATSVAVSSSILHTDGIPKTYEDIYGMYKETDGTFSYTALSLVSSVGRYVGQGFYVGGSAKFLYEDNAGESGAGLAFDVSGLYISPNEKWSLGASARNMGRGLRLRDATEPLPSQLAAGAAVALIDSSLVTSLDVAMTSDAGTRFSWGAEQRLRGSLFLRGGYTVSTEKTAHKGFTMGAGIVVKGLSIDYSAVDYQELGLVHRFTLAVGGW
ncbi:MAG: PorV/PorQ family protein [Candidatus Eiseniibacteriota bacterium]|nr:MAG: PorV/PorQ family protein [Candidatus Eisenbacteria bacterium]